MFTASLGDGGERSNLNLEDVKFEMPLRHPNDLKQKVRYMRPELAERVPGWKLKFGSLVLYLLLKAVTLEGIFKTV